MKLSLKSHAFNFKIFGLVRLNRISFPDIYAALKLRKESLISDEIVNLIRIGHTFKTTQTSRYPLSLRLLRALTSGKRVTTFYEVGSSSGRSASSYLVSTQPEYIYLLDKYNSISVYHLPFVFLLSASSSRVEMCVLPYLTIYTNRFIGSLFAKVLRLAKKQTDISFVDQGSLRKLYNNSTVVFKDCDIFYEFGTEVADVLVVPNLLNPSYFSDAMLLCAITNCIRAVVVGGLFLVVENRSAEGSSIFKKISHDHLQLVQRVGGGSDIEQLIVSHF